MLTNLVLFQVGNVTFAAIIASGTAVVNFRDPESATRAINLDWAAYPWEGSQLTVVADTEMDTG